MSRCFNFGVVKASNNDSYVGGIVGSASTEISHCYNSSIVEGKDYVGGICGELKIENGELKIENSIHHCYNVGSVSATGTHKGTICGDGNFNYQFSTFNFYDRQMCPMEDNNATALYTQQMTGTALQSVLGTDSWSYNNNEYPQIKYWDSINSRAAALSVKPLLLSGYMPADDIVQNFSGVTGDNVHWGRYGNGPETVEVSQSVRDSLLLKLCGVDTLHVHVPQTEQSSPCEHRLVPIKVTGKIDDTHVTIDTSCASSYTWSVNGATYKQSGFYTYVDGSNACSDKYALHLTIAKISCSIDQISATCSTISDGALMATARGGLGNGFTYYWKRNGSSQILSNDNYVTGLSAGSYYLLIKDAVRSTCSTGKNVTLNVQPQVALTIAACIESRPYDGNALTGNRFVVTEAGHAPDTVAANRFAVLSNGDTLRVTLTSGEITNVGTLAEPVEITSYTIRNGVDHSCHYDVTTTPGFLTVTPRPVLITVGDASKEVGADDPTFSGTVAGLVNEGDLGAITYSRSNNDVEEVGNYPDVLTASYTANSNYSVTINPGDFLIDCRHLSTRISIWPTADITGVDECCSPDNTDTLPSASDIKTWITGHNLITSGTFEVAIKDSLLRADHCDWRWARIYTIETANSGYCDVESHALYVSGGDQSAPEHSDNYLWTYGTIPQNACLASFNMDLFLPRDEDLFEDCSGFHVTHWDTYTGNDREGWTIRRDYEVTDACGNTRNDYVEVHGRDLTPPMASNPKVKKDTLWAPYTQCLCDSIHVINNFTELKTLFDLSDECTGDDISLVSKTRTFKTGDHCADTVVVAYRVTDPYGNAKTFYHAQFIQDTIGPTFSIVPFHDTTLCVDPDGDYEATVNRIAALVSLSNIQDNCTKGYMEVDTSITFDPSEHGNDGYDTDNNLGEVTYGKRTYSQVWSVTDSCGNTTRNMLYIHLYPLATIRIDSLGYQEITYGQDIKDVLIHHQYSNLALYPLNFGGISLDNNDDTTGTLKGTPDSAGTFIYTLRATSWHDCNIVDTTVKIKVNPRPITITAASATKKYDGKPLTSNNYICSLTPPFGDINNNILVPGDSIASVTIIGSQTHVGTNLNTPSNARITICTADTVDKNPSYAISYANGTLEVIPNDTLITVIPASGTKVYDGTPLTKNRHSDFTVIGVPEGLTWTATADGTVTNVTPGEGEKAVNAVTSFHIFDADGVDVTDYFTNIHTDSTGTLTITKEPLTITADNATKVYDGTALTKNSYTLAGLVTGETITSVTITGSQTLAGTSDNVPSDAVIVNLNNNDNVNDNYDITYVNGTLEVIQKPLTITAGSDTIVYNGAWLTNNTYTHSALVTGDNLVSVTVTGRALYGESDNVPSAAVIKNGSEEDVTASYNITYVNGHLKIKQKELFIRSGDSSKVYDGTELTCHTFTYSGLVQTDTIVTVVWESSLKNADTIDNVISLTAIQNTFINDTDVTNCYIIEPVYGRLTVTPKPLTITAASDSKVYDGTALTKDSYTHTELVPGDSIWSVSIVGSQTVAGTSANVPSGADIQNSTPDHVTANYAITYVDGTLTVTPRPLTITAGNETKKYDGIPLTGSTYTTDGDLATGDRVESVAFGSSRKLVGTSDNVPVSAVIKNDTNENVTASYNISYVNGTLTVTETDTMVTIIPGSASKDYDGTPLTCNTFTVTGLPEGHTWTATADGTVTNVIPGDGEKRENAVTSFHIFDSDGTEVTSFFTNRDTSSYGELRVWPRLAYIRVNDAWKYYGDPDPEFSGTVENVVNEGDLGTVVYRRVHAGMNEYEAVGTYISEIEPDCNFLNTNYYVDGEDGTLEIVCGRSRTIDNEGWHAITSTLHNYGQTYWTIDDSLLTGRYDMFRYIEASSTWENQKYYDGSAFSTMEPGRGYLYRRADEKEICIGGTPNTGSFTYALSCTAEADKLKGFHLVGNPYGSEILKGTHVTYPTNSVATGYYTLNTDGSWLAHTDNSPIASGEGFLVQALTATTLTFNDNPAKKGQVAEAPSLAFRVTDGEHEDLCYAIRRYEVGGKSDSTADVSNGLHKMAHLDKELPMLCIALDSNHYAIAVLDDDTKSFEMPFTGKEGTYTLSVRDMEVGGWTYCHLIDHLTGDDIDLLEHPSYTFCHTSEQPFFVNRFEVKLSPEGGWMAEAEGNFAHIEGENLTITGTGTLIAYDVIGRELFRREIKNEELRMKNSDFPGTGVYVLRLGEKSQKIVIR